MNSRVGRAWDAIREDEDAAELMGVPTFKFKLWAFAIGAAIGGIAGTLYAGKVTYVTPGNFTLELSIMFLAAVVLGGTALSGGIASVIASSVAALFLTQLNQIVLAAGWPTSTQYIVQSLVILIVVIIRETVYRLLAARARRRMAAPAEQSPQPTPV